MKLEEADSEEDSETGRAFFGLIQPEYFPVDASGNRLGPRERVLLDHNHPQEMLSYDSSKFPTFCGRSATFSIWWESSTDAGMCAFTMYAQHMRVSRMLVLMHFQLVRACSTMQPTHNSEQMPPPVC